MGGWKTKEAREAWKEKNLEKIRKQNKDLREKNREKNAKYAKEYVEKNKEETERYRKQWRNQPHINKRIKLKKTNKRKELRKFVIEKYGGKCACCGEGTYEFLVLDHKDGGGNKHRKEVPTASLVRWIIKNNFPSSIRVLCSNCNQSYGSYGHCPHNAQQVIQNG